jgi:hypothetical protein
MRCAEGARDTPPVALMLGPQPEASGKRLNSFVDGALYWSNRGVEWLLRWRWKDVEYRPTL